MILIFWRENNCTYMYFRGCFSNCVLQRMYSV